MLKKKLKAGKPGLNVTKKNRIRLLIIKTLTREPFLM